MAEEKHNISEEHNIGTLNEGSLHAALKDWVSEPGDRFEVPLGRFVIDVMRDGLLIEVQTGAISAMGRKLDHLLEDHRIRIVHPLAATRWLEQPGKKRRKSPSKCTVWNVLDQLVSIPTLLDHPNLELLIVMIEETEVRSGNDMVRRGRRGRVTDRRLEQVIDTHLFSSQADLLAMLPDDLPQPWTTADLALGAGIRRDMAQKFAYVLRTACLVEEVERTRAGIVYRS
ncbi:MAG: hypothetical protein ACI8Y4_005060 [Candidatus Poriferisodalaceae bacterium]